REQIIINHRAVIVAVQSAATLLEHSRPEKHGAGERDQPEHVAQEIIPAIHERVLEPDVKDGSVLRDSARAHTPARAPNRNRIEKMSRASLEPSPALLRPPSPSGRGLR